MALPPVFGRVSPLAARGPARGLAFTPPASQDLTPTFPMAGQEQTFWCWAAVSKSVDDHFAGPGHSQCDVATGTLPSGERKGVACCGTSRGGACDKPYYLEKGLAFVGHFDRLAAGPTSMADIQSEIAGARPLCVRIQWPDRSGHFVTVTGWEQPGSGVDYVHVHDPNGPAFATMTLQDLETSYTSAKGRWTHSYFTAAAPAGGGAYLSDTPDPDTLGG